MTADILQRRLHRVQRAPEGPQVLAVFDYDGTLLDGWSGVAHFRSRFRGLDVTSDRLPRVLGAIRRGIRSTEDFEVVLDWTVETYRGEGLADLLDEARAVYARRLVARLRPETLQLWDAHRARGHTMVVASSGQQVQVTPVAEHLEADHVICTRLAHDDGVLTGAVDGEAMWSGRKAAAVRRLAEELGADLDESFAYADGDEDVPLLKAVGQPTAVSPRRGMRRAAAEHGWPVLQGVRTRATVAPTAMVRTGALVTGFLGGVSIGAGIGLLRGSTRTFIDTSMGLATDLGMGLAGVDIEVVAGHEHLWSSRPCVFIFNHRSNLDPLVVMHVVREGVSGVAKKEIARVPGMGGMLRRAGVVLVDRDNTRQRKDAVPDAVRLVEEGLSVLIAPEGTRARSSRIGPFKKGAFHIARQAGIPVVPVVLKGVGELLPPGQVLVRPGRAEVTVLPPVDVADWPEGELASRIEDVRQAMVAALATWPID